MTRWECPEDVVMDAPPYGRVVRAVDVPRIVRAAARKAILAVAYDKEGNFDQRVATSGDAYLRARFPEAAPEPMKSKTVAEMCDPTRRFVDEMETLPCRVMEQDKRNRAVPTPSVPAEPDGRCPVLINGARCILSTRPHDKHTAYPHPHPAPPPSAPAELPACTCHRTPVMGDAALRTLERDCPRHSPDPKVAVLAAPPSEAPAKPKCKYVGGGDCEPVAAARPEAGEKSIAAMTGPELVEHLEQLLSRDEAYRVFVRVLAQAYFDAEANLLVLKHSDTFLAAKELLTKVKT